MARLWYLPTVLILGFLIIAPLSTLTGMAGPMLGWMLFLPVPLLSILTVPIAGIAGAIARLTKRSWAGAALRGAVVPLLVLAGLLLPQIGKLEPVIHDVTTDLEDGLTFGPGVPEREERMSRDEVLKIQRQAYPELRPLTLERDPASAFELARAKAEEMPGWEVVRSDAQAGTINAVATSRIFKFEDDVVIRVQAEGAGSRIDVRSRSRFGESDLGANAARIEAYLAALGEP